MLNLAGTSNRSVFHFKVFLYLFLDKDIKTMNEIVLNLDIVFDSKAIFTKLFLLVCEQGILSQN